MTDQCVPDDIDQVNVQSINMIDGDPPDMLTAEQAATRLGVKRATIYAYVSRGTLTRTLSLDGKTSLFAAREVDRLRQRNRRPIRGELSTVISTSVANVSDGRIEIRGRDLPAMAAKGASFEDCCELLWQSHGARPWPNPAPLPPTDLGPLASPADRIRLAVVAASAADPLKFDNRPSHAWDRARRLIRTMAAAPGDSAGPPLDSVAGTLWNALSDRDPQGSELAALDTALALLCDHGLAASTFAVRIAASVRADPYSAVLAGLGVLGGRLHGAASRSVHNLLDEAAAQSPESAVGQQLAASRRLPGVGHMIHTEVDPRWPVLYASLKGAWQSHPQWEVADATVRLLASQPVGPNIDLGLGLLTWLGGLSPTDGEAVFAVARTAGWLAHADDESTEHPNRFRPQARQAGR